MNVGITRLILPLSEHIRISCVSMKYCDDDNENGAKCLPFIGIFGIMHVCDLLVYVVVTIPSISGIARVGHQDSPPKS